MKIWKWNLEIVGHQALEMPKDAKILCVMNRQRMWGLQLWALCDEGATKEKRYFAIYATGQTLPDTWYADKYIGTVGNGLVWHVFETGPKV